MTPPSQKLEKKESDRVFRGDVLNLEQSAEQDDSEFKPTDDMRRASSEKTGSRFSPVTRGGKSRRRRRHHRHRRNSTMKKSKKVRKMKRNYK